MASLTQEAAMKPTHSKRVPARPALYAAPRRARHLRNACLAYGAIVFASMAAAAAVVTETAPLLVGVI
jgi:hypothetical protein